MFLNCILYFEESEPHYSKFHVSHFLKKRACVCHSALGGNFLSLTSKGCQDSRVLTLACSGESISRLRIDWESSSLHIRINSNMFARCRREQVWRKTNAKYITDIFPAVESKKRPKLSEHTFWMVTHYKK